MRNVYFILSFVGYPCIERLLSCLRTTTNRPEYRQHVLRNRIISLLHNLITTTIAGWISFRTNIEDPGLLHQPISGLSRLLHFETGYILQDTLMEFYSLLTFEKWGGRSILMHHIVVLIALVSYRFIKLGDYYIAVLLLMTASNIFLHGGYLASHYHGQHSIIARLFRCIFPLSYVLSRFAIFPWIFYVYSAQRSYQFSWWEAPLYLKPYCQLGTIFFGLLNIWLALNTLRSQKRAIAQS